MHMPHLDTSRRIKRVCIEPVVLAGMLMKPQDGVKLEIENGVPQSAGVVGGGYDWERNCFVLFVADKSFEEVPEGTVPPDLPVAVRAVYGTSGVN